MPDARLGLLIRLCLQNKGHLAKGRRGDFQELTEDEIRQIENIINDSFRK